MNDVKLDAFDLQFINDGVGNKLPMCSLCEVLNFLVHGLFEFVPVRLFPGFTEVHCVWIDRGSCACADLNERMDAVNFPIGCGG